MPLSVERVATWAVFGKGLDDDLGPNSQPKWERAVHLSIPRGMDVNDPRQICSTVHIVHATAKDLMRLANGRDTAIPPGRWRRTSLYMTKKLFCLVM